MTDTKPKAAPKVTVNLRRNGYFEGHDFSPEGAKAAIRYEVASVQNTLDPSPMDQLNRDQVQALIDRGWTVNIK